MGQGTMGSRRVSGSVTVEAALILPILLICIFWITDRGINLYTETVELSKRQEVWEDFNPAEKFRKLELRKDVF